MNIIKSDYKEQILEKLRIIDTEGLSDEIITSSKVVEEQKIYFWIRLYLNEENNSIQFGDDVVIKWNPSGEELETKFICYGKLGLEKDHNGEVVNYNPEDDKRILCLMVDEKVVNFSDDIPFIRTLFKTGYHYDYQLIRREDLLFSIKKNGDVLEYYDCDF